MVSSPEKEHPLIERRVEEPGEMARLDEEKSELEDYLQKIEREPQKELVRDEVTGQVVLTPNNSQPADITLPLTEAEIKHGLHHKIGDSIRWLAQWCARMTKKAITKGLRIGYREETTQQG